MAQVIFNVNDAFVPRIVAAFRSEFPVITTGLPDGQAVKAVIITLVKEILSEFEAQQAVAPTGTQIQTLTGQFQTTFAAQAAQTQSDVGVNVT